MPTDLSQRPRGRVWISSEDSRMESILQVGNVSICPPRHYLSGRLLDF